MVTSLTSYRYCGIGLSLQLTELRLSSAMIDTIKEGSKNSREWLVGYTHTHYLYPACNLRPIYDISMDEIAQAQLGSIAQC